MKRFAALGLMILSPAAQAATPVPEVLPDRFIAAWNAHDPQAFEALYTSDAVWVPVAEERTEGRTAIVAAFAQVHGAAGWAARTTIARKDAPEVHFVTPDVATIFFQLDFVSNGKAVAGLQRAMMLVAVRRAGTWKIAAGQLTKESPAPG